MTDPTETSPAPEAVRIPDHDLDDLAGVLAKTVADVRRHGVLLDRLSAETDPAPADSSPGPDAPDSSRPEEPSSAFILALGGEAYAAELAALNDWVNHLLLPVYGREISTAHPWCEQWREHPEAVARLHALWLAWQQLTDAEAGPTGPSIWHRDHLDHALAQLRAPDGPFSACTTSPTRPSHRLLPTPGAVTERAAQ